MNLSELAQDTFYSGHAIERLQERYPNAGVTWARETVEGGEVLSVEQVKAYTRRVSSGDRWGDRSVFVLDAKGFGIWVFVPNRIEGGSKWYAVTYLRLADEIVDIVNKGAVK